MDEDRVYRPVVEDPDVVQPGYFFDFPQGDHLLVSPITPVDEFAERVSRAARLLSAAMSADGRFAARRERHRPLQLVIGPHRLSRHAASA